MEIEGRGVLILGGSGLVGAAIARRLLRRRPSRIVVAGLHEEEARSAVGELEADPASDGVELVPEWGNVFAREAQKDRPRDEILASDRERFAFLDDLFAPLTEERMESSALWSLLARHRPEILVDCINTATAIAYQDVFGSAKELREASASSDGVPRERVERHLATLQLPRLIRHVQILLGAMLRTETRLYLKIGTTGTGGMGLNVPFTHSERRPSPQLLSKASVAGAHSLLLFLMGRTPGAPVVKEIKPSAAIAWKKIAFGPVIRDGEPIPRYDAEEELSLEEAFEAPEEAWRRLDGVVESVYLDAGENGLFSTGEFEAISSLGSMELVTPEEIADLAIAEIEGRATGRDIVAALDGASLGPSYRAGVMREAALRRMEELEAEHGVRSIAFEMLGPPRLSKLLFEAAILERLYPDLDAAASLGPEETARRAEELVRADARLRTDVLSVGVPILLPDGGRLLRGPEVKAAPEAGEEADVSRWAAQGWVDLRAESWARWGERCRGFLADVVRTPGPEAGSRIDIDVRGRSGAIRPGALAAYVFRTEDEGERILR